VKLLSDVLDTPASRVRRRDAECADAKFSPEFTVGAAIWDKSNFGAFARCAQCDDEKQTGKNFFIRKNNNKISPGAVSIPNK
jgi:hypothetical protein